MPDSPAAQRRLVDEWALTGEPFDAKTAPAAGRQGGPCGVRPEAQAVVAKAVGWSSNCEAKIFQGRHAMKIDCLMGTYGRYELVCEALACFLQQSAISKATLLIYNQHPEPLFFEHPRVRVVNETGPKRALRYIRQRMHELAIPDADLIHWWDDDDLYLPWHLQDCLDHIGDSVAWKPATSWLSWANTRFVRDSYRFEGSWIFRTSYLKGAPIDTHPDYTDHPVILQTEESGTLATTELGDLTSYIYRWDTGTPHLSAFGASGSDEQQAEFVELWRSQSTDVRPDGQLRPADLSLRWQQYLDGTRDQMAPENWERNRAKLRLSSAA